MKTAFYIIIVLVVTMVFGMCIMAIAGCEKKEPVNHFEEWWVNQLSEKIDTLKTDVAMMRLASDIYRKYDPNDPAYKFIPPAPKEWRDKFGDTERTRLIHSISELRVVVAEQSKHILALENALKQANIIPDSNEGK